MKSSTIIQKILDSKTCSIATAEQLTNALHKEQKLAHDKAVRFRPLFGDFDIVNSDLFRTGKFNINLCEKVGDIYDLIKRIESV